MVRDLHHFVFGSEEEEDGPGEDPEEGQVKEPADPCGGSPLIYPSGSVDNQTLVCSGEADV